MRRIALLALALVAILAPSLAEAQAKPVVAILYFDNNSIGKDRADYDGIGKGMADLLITDMSQNPNIKVVERERIQALLTEQQLTRSGSIDPATAVRLGKIIGAQYMIYGGFMSDGRGNYTMTARAFSVETSEILNPVRLNSKGDDVLGLMAQLSERLNREMKLPAMRVGDAGPAATPAGQPSAEPAQVAAAPAAEPKPAEPKAVPAESKAASTPAPARAAAPAPVSKPATVTESKPKGKMDMRTALLYSKALEEEDAGNRAKALELYKQVVDRFPLPAAEAKIRKYSRG